jgi:hypothetical protein
MSSDDGAPPILLAYCVIRDYVIIEPLHTYSGRTWHFVGSEELGRVPRLAIGQELDGGETRLFHCDAEWNILASMPEDSPAAAMARAERIYPGLASLWIHRQVSDEEGRRVREEEALSMTCSFCGRRPDQVNQLVESKDSRICDHCLREFAASLGSE